MRRSAVAVRVLLLLLVLACAVGCATPPAARPALGPDDTIRAAQQLLTDRCLTRRGLTPPRPGRETPSPAEQRRTVAALFGAGRAELSLPLPTGHVVRTHTDGCLAAAQRALYGDQRRWFRTSTTVNNLKPLAAHDDRSLAAVRAEHRAELAAYRRLRDRALARATTLLDREHGKHPTEEPS